MEVHSQASRTHHSVFVIKWVMETIPSSGQTHGLLILFWQPGSPFFIGLHNAERSWIRKFVTQLLIYGTCLYKNLKDEEAMDWAKLMSILKPFVLPHREDKWKWLPKTDGVFTTKYIKIPAG